MPLWLLAGILPVVLIINGTGDISKRATSGEVAQADSSKVLQEASSDEFALPDLPPLLVVKVRFAERTEAFTVESYGLEQGKVLRPGSNPEHRYLYQAISRSGEVLAEGTFDMVLRPREADRLSVTPDDVVHLADNSILIRIPYDAEIASLSVLKALAPNELAALRDRASRGEQVPVVVRAARTGQSAVELSSSAVEAATAQPVQKALRLSGGVIFRAGQGITSESSDLVTDLNGNVENDFRLNQDTGSVPQNEPFIAINPINPSNLVGGSNDYRRGNVAGYFSLDGGQTWRDQLITNPTNFFAASDPGIAADAQGNFYYSFVALNFDRSGNPTDNGVFVTKSTNGGQRFNTPAVVMRHFRETNPDFEDKPFIAADNNPMSPFANNVYVSWTNFQASGGQAIKFSRSVGGGAFSTQSTLKQTSTPIMQDSLPVVGPNGEVYVVWDHATTFRVIRSLDGGATFLRDRFAASFFPIGTMDSSSGRQVLNGGFRVSDYPSMAVDTSNGPHRGTLYLVWSDGRNGDADIFFTRSTDGGQTWTSPPIRINDDPVSNGKDQFFQWISVDPTNGNIVVMFYDRRNDPNNLILDVYVTRSTDGGDTFEPCIQVNKQSFNPRNDGGAFGGQFLGDYNGLVTFGNIAYPVWTDTRRGQEDIFGARVNFGP
jgi:hypothetical protein